MRISRQTPDQMVITDSAVLHVAVLALCALACIGAVFGALTLGLTQAALWFGAGAVAFLGLAFAMRRSTTVVLDRAAGTVSLTETGFRGRGQVTHPFGALKGAMLQSIRISRGQSPLRSHRPILRLEGADALPIRRAYHRRIGNAERVIAGINRWLGV